MASLFNNLGMPLVIMFTLPMALVGALGALVLTGEKSVADAAIGIIMLVGLMGRNAILLLDYTTPCARVVCPRRRHRGGGRDPVCALSDDHDSHYRRHAACGSPHRPRLRDSCPYGDLWSSVVCWFRPC